MKSVNAPNEEEEIINKKKKGKLSGKPAKHKRESVVWEHFTQHVAPRPEDTRMTCNHYGKSLASNPKIHRTSSLRHHMLHKCMKHPDKQAVDVMIQITLAFDIMKEGENGNEGNLISVQFSEEEARKAITKYIVMSELSFRHVESKAFKRLIQRICHKLSPLSRMTISRDPNKMYLDEKEKIKEGLEKRKNFNYYRYMDINLTHKLHGDHGSSG